MHVIHKSKCKVCVLKRARERERAQLHLFKPEKGVSDVEFMRTVCSKLGVAVYYIFIFLMYLKVLDGSLDGVSPSFFSLSLRYVDGAVLKSS